ncbi:interferon-induced protein 44-like [Mercenaria mercenaria]|uniref:interferon-induced protein 44-like n=1 Tax=Mercenaria mercenaria TaxID=6596 RepID=UPI00234EFAE3|nr:interferon-induced protein 44-like [Mercenaria mercenaria]
MLNMFRSLGEWFNGPWRKPAKDQWNERLHNQLIEDVRTIRFRAGVQKAGILLCGPFQSGKSTLINTIFSISQGRPAYVSAAFASDRNVTFQFIKAPDDCAFNNFEIRDTVGLSEGQGLGFNIQDLVYALNGNIKANYKFKGDVPIQETDPFFLDSPSNEDKSHCLVIVLDVTLLDTITDRICNKFRQVVDETISKGVPIVLILTKIDKIYPYLRKDIKYLFHSSIVQTAVTKAELIFGIQKKNIHPVLNFTDNTEVDPIECIPILLALKQILHYASDHIRFHLNG